MTRPIGPREAAMRAQREENAKAQEAKSSKPFRKVGFVEASVADLAAKLPAASGKKPVKRKRKK